MRKLPALFRSSASVRPRPIGWYARGCPSRFFTAAQTNQRSSHAQVPAQLRADHPMASKRSRHRSCFRESESVTWGSGVWHSKIQRGCELITSHLLSSKMSGKAQSKRLHFLLVVSAMSGHHGQKCQAERAAFLKPDSRASVTHMNRMTPMQSSAHFLSMWRAPKSSVLEVRSSSRKA